MAAVQVRQRLLPSALVLIAFAASGCSDDDSSSTSAPRITADVGLIRTNDAQQGEPLAAVTVRTLDGDGVDTGSLVGQPLVINVWSSTCIPCRDELPAFAAVHAQYGDQVRFVGIDYLGADDREEQFARDLGVDYELLYDTDGEFLVATGLNAFPVTLFVNADGMVVRQTGALTQD